jgi:2-(3-amino-3-carboxypropyl)histidine synthase
MKILHIPCYSDRNPISAVKKALKKLEGYNSIGLITTAQHLNRVDDITLFLEKSGKKVIVGGQILGCNQKAAEIIEKKVDAFLYVGSGIFHPQGVAAKTEKPVIIANPYSGEVSEITDDEKGRILRKRKGAVARALEARKFGILISPKDGQFRGNEAIELKAKIEKSGRKAFLFVGNEINPDNVLGFDVDAWINTACPRISDDHFSKPVLNPEEVEYIL